MDNPRQYRILSQVLAERDRQDEKWGEQNHPDLSPYLGGIRVPTVIATYYGIPAAREAKFNCDAEHARGEGSWFSIHVEELAEALEQAALGDTDAMRTELIQLIATLTAHVEHIDRRKDTNPS